MGLAVLYFLDFPRACAGYNGIYPVLISLGLLILIFFMNIILEFQLGGGAGEVRKWIPFCILSVILATGWILSGIIQKPLKGDKILKAYTARCKCGDLSTLTLFGNGSYVIKMAETEFVCRYTGSYTLKADTLFLEKNILEESDSTYFPVYLIDAGDSLLRPVINGRVAGNNDRALNLSLLDFRRVSEGKITSVQ